MIKERNCWVLLYPDGKWTFVAFEDYSFRMKPNYDIPITPEEWRKTYHPVCKLVQAKISLIEKILE